MQKEMFGYLLDSVGIMPELASFRFWPEAPLLDKPVVEPLQAASRSSKKTKWLPGEDSNLEPCGYKCPILSDRLGLSHHPEGCRALRPPPPRGEGLRPFGLVSARSLRR